MQLLSSFYSRGNWGSERKDVVRPSQSLTHTDLNGSLQIPQYHSKVWWSKTFGPKLVLHWLGLESPFLYSSEKAADKWSLLFVPFVFVLRCLWLNSLISLAVKAVWRKMGLNCCGFWVLDWMSETFAITGNSVTLDLLSVPRSRIPQQCDLAPGSPSASFGIYLNALPHWFP